MSHGNQQWALSVTLRYASVAHDGPTGHGLEEADVGLNRCFCYHCHESRTQEVHFTSKAFSDNLYQLLVLVYLLALYLLI